MKKLIKYFSNISVIFLNILVFILIIALNIIGFIQIHSYEQKINTEFQNQIRQLSYYWDNIFHADELELIEPGMELNDISIYYQSLLAELKRNLNLMDIKIIDRSKKLLVDSDIQYNIGQPVSIDTLLWGKINSPGERLHFIQHSNGSNMEGIVEVLTELYNSDNIPTAFLLIRMKPNLLSALMDFKHTLYVLNMVFILIVLLLGILSTIYLRKYLRAQEEIYQKERLSQLGEMTAIIAHEIRNPLGIIKGSTSVLKKKLSAEKDKEIIRFIEEEINRLNHLVTQMLTFVKKPQLNPVLTDINTFIHHIVQMYQKQLKDVTIRFNGSHGISVFIDTDAMRQIILNIFNNALHALETVDYKKEMDITVSGDSHVVQLTICNNGPSIPEKSLKQIFKPFFTTKDKGSGLGLPVSKVLIEHMKGSIHIKNKKPGPGVEVIIELPIMKGKRAKQHA